MEKKKFNYKVVLTVLATLIAIKGGKYLIDQFDKSSIVIDKKLLEASQEVNKNLPMMLSSGLRVDSTMALPDKTFQYVLTLINVSKDELNLEELKKISYKEVLNNVKTSSDLKPFRDNKVTLIYLYKDKNNNEIFKLIFTYNDYKE